MRLDPKRVITWVIILVVPIAAAAIISGLFQFIEPGSIVTIVKDHFAATIGLPMAALLSVFIVVGLRHSEGSIKFEGLGFKFEGASGQVILWVFCFLAIAGAIRLLWRMG